MRFDPFTEFVEVCACLGEVRHRLREFDHGQTGHSEALHHGNQLMRIEAHLAHRAAASRASVAALVPTWAGPAPRACAAASVRTSASGRRRPTAAVTRRPSATAAAVTANTATPYGQRPRTPS